MLQTLQTLINAKQLFITTVVVVLMMQAMTCDANNQPELFQRHTRKRLCGAVLSDTLQLICSMYVEKKSADDYDTFPYNEPMQKDWNGEMIIPGQENSPFLNKIAAAALPQSGFRRIRRGVSDCCRKSCSMSELMSYCNRKGGLNSYND
ncbi:bombyxin B-1 homolog [Culicoides brevitarsis]|uniref:bombyxin B-1 homolog n=1 Tax=Culicoides brevitarsis TaxID=469753 RepID=UPI00307BA90D